MDDRLTKGSLYRADLLWCLSAIVEDQHSQLVALLGFEKDKPPAKETENEKPIA